MAAGKNIPEIIDTLEKNPRSWLPYLMLIIAIVGALIATRSCLRDDMKDAIRPLEKNIEKVESSVRKVVDKLDTVDEKIESKGELELGRIKVVQKMVKKECLK